MSAKAAVLAILILGIGWLVLAAEQARPEAVQPQLRPLRPGGG